MNSITPPLVPHIWYVKKQKQKKPKHVKQKYFAHVSVIRWSSQQPAAGPVITNTVQTHTTLSAHSSSYVSWVRGEICRVEYFHVRTTSIRMNEELGHIKSSYSTHHHASYSMYITVVKQCGSCPAFKFSSRKWKLNS